MSDQGDISRTHKLIWNGMSINNLTEVLILQHSAGGIVADHLGQVDPQYITLNQGAFKNKHAGIPFPEVIVVQTADNLSLSCDCYAERDKLCDHQGLVLLAIIKREELRIFYDAGLRDEKLRKVAAAYGLEEEADLDQYFSVEFPNAITPRNLAILPVTKESLSTLASLVTTDAPQIHDEEKVIIIIKEHRYYKYLFVELYSAQTTKDGRVKNPLKLLPPLDSIWETEDHDQLKFFTGIHKFQNHLNTTTNEADITALRAIVKNPLGYEFYYHAGAEKVTANNIVPVYVKNLPNDLHLNVKSNNQFFEISGQVINGFELKDLAIKFTYFIAAGNTLYLANNLQILNLVGLLAKKKDNLLVHNSKYPEFKSQLLSKLEDKVAINYKYIPLASSTQKKDFVLERERIIYLSDFGTHVMIIPVMRYGEVEISIRTKRQIYAVDAKGKEFMVPRDDAGEIEFAALLIKQHQYFNEQLDNDLHYFYLHKKHFLDEDWFLGVFEEWQLQKITILGFNELESNKLNPYKVKITIRVLSGINWFNTLINVKFGKSRAALKQVYRAVKNKTKYVQLDDGTTGILPAEWLTKFNDYFNAGEIADDRTLQISKMNFGVIEQLFDAEMFDDEVLKEINIDTENIKPVTIPLALTGTLRPYQQHGLNWLNFLDDHGFGGCLADDMGLGKSIQVIAFVLLQRAKIQQNTNLIVVPTSLIFNWQQELEKFAPSIKVKTIYGAERIKNIKKFDEYEVILTSYGTLLLDVNFLKDYRFNYVFLDESQQIKNPDSQRYKAARLLKARNRIVITGTPIENNTFDLYGQLSFACPGLFGSKQYFRDIYSIPIDKFKSSNRASELQSKIKPFVLRRTKQQVAAELPEKTEMILYCNMETEQENIYKSYEKEFRDFISATNGDVLRKSAMHVLKGITKLRQICDSPLLLKGEKMPGNASAKIDVLLSQIAEKSPQHKILVFSQFVEMLDLIRLQLILRNIHFSYLTGKTRNRQEAIEKFQDNQETRVFLISLKAGGTGLNLTAADYVYLVDPWWNPAVENQAIDRCHRIGQDKPIVAVRMICPGTIEEKVMLLQQAKKELSDKLIQTDEPRLDSLSKNELLGLLN